MNKRLLKRHKRQVARAKEKIRLSEPDVRPPEQVRAARGASRAATDRRTGAQPHYSTSPTPRQAEIAAKTVSQPDGAETPDGQGAGSPKPVQPGKEIL